jgi:hypothetical protein
MPLTEDDSGVILACHNDFHTTHERTRQVMLALNPNVKVTLVVYLEI